MLSALCEERIVWKIKMRDGTPFGIELLGTLGKILDPTASDHGEAATQCACFYITWRTLDKALLCYAGDKCDVVAALSTQDWKTAFDGCHGAEEQKSEFYIFKLRSYRAIVGRAYRVLRDDQNNASALKIVGDLGSCHKFCRRVLSKFPKIASKPTAEERFFLLRLVGFLFALLFSHLPANPKRSGISKAGTVRSKRDFEQERRHACIPKIGCGGSSQDGRAPGSFGRDQMDLGHHRDCKIPSPQANVSGDAAAAVFNAYDRPHARRGNEDRKTYDQDRQKARRILCEFQRIGRHVRAMPYARVDA